MKRFALLLYLVFTLVLCSFADDFDRWFDEETLRIDVRLMGKPGTDTVDVQIDSIALWSGWYGRRVNLDSIQYPEALKVVVVDKVTDTPIYIDAKSPEAYIEMGDSAVAPVYSTLFVPKPRASCDLVVTYCGFDSIGNNQEFKAVCQLSGLDLLLMQEDTAKARVPYKTLRKAKDSKHCVNFAIIAEGYTECELDSFCLMAARLDSVLFSQPAYRERADDFNVVAVMLPSPESGISIPSQGVKVNSALASHFDSFGLERLVTVPDTRVMWDALQGIPASQIMIIANTEKYGGSGSYNEYAIASAGPDCFTEIMIHELGHSFAWLGDEYEAGYSISYTSDFEPLEPNITTLHDFSHKWQNLIDSGEASLIEGAGYQSKGVWRGCQNCLMRDLADKVYCVVCAQAINRTIDYFTKP